MQPNDAKRFNEVLGAVMDLYGRALNAMTMRLWFEALAEFSLGDVQDALSTHVRDPNTGQFPPKPADVVKHLTGDRTTLESEAALAWSKTVRSIGRVGGYASVAFDDAAIHSAIEGMGGWPKLCITPEGELPFRAKDFQALYVAFRTQRGGFTYPAHLPGRGEIERNAAGMLERFPVPIRLIGEDRAVRSIMEHGRGEATALPESLRSIGLGTVALEIEASA